MKHIRYLSTNRTVCDDPEALGEDFVVLDYSPDDSESCKVCLQLLTAHNKREYERDGLVNLIQGHNRLEDPVSERDLVRGWLLGLLFATAFWIGAALMFWWIFRG